MVTDEERDYMYRVYARDRQARINLGIRRRLAPLLGNNRRKIELMNGLLCSLPGTPVIYYGDEIGMGDNIYLGDRHGVRTPMQWSPDRNAGFSRANPQRLYSPVIIDSEYLFETVNVETQQKNPHSLLWWMKRLIALRQHYVALQRGSIELLAPENSKILAFTRDHEDQSVLMVANLSRFVQFVELDLSRFAGRRPVELFGQTRFPAIGKTPYVLTLSPHAFFWFALEREAAETGASTTEGPELARLTVPEGPHEIHRGRIRKNFEAILARELPRRHWLVGALRKLQSVQIVDYVPLGKTTSVRHAPGLLVLRVEYLEGESEMYLLPLGTAWGPEIEKLAAASPPVIALLQKSVSKETGVLFDASLDPTASATLLRLMVDRRRFKGSPGELVGWSNSELSELAVSELADLKSLPAVPIRVEQGNNSMLFGDKCILKTFRRLESGTNPDLEIGRFLADDSVRFPHTLPLLGAAEYRVGDDESYTVAVLHGYVPNTVTAWQFTQDALGRFFEHVLTQAPEARPAAPATPRESLWDLAGGDAPSLAKDLLGAYLEWAALLGRRTAELHIALASDNVEANFAPEPFTQLYQRSLYQSSRKRTLQAFQRLRGSVKALPETTQALARDVLDHEKQLLECFRAVVGPKIAAQRIRCHGDYHLGHVLYTGKDFLIIDFEGEPSLSLSARRIKRSALEDVAGMIQSFHFAVSQALPRWLTIGVVTPDAEAALRQAAHFWYLWSSSAFLKAYAAATSGTSLLPNSRAQLDLLLQVHLLEEAVYELQYDLNDSPDQLSVALNHILELLAV